VKATFNTRKTNWTDLCYEQTTGNAWNTSNLSAISPSTS